MCSRAPLSFLNAIQTEARARLHPCVANAHTEGVEFWERGLTEGDVQERKRPHIHVTEGSRKILSNGLIPARFHSPAFQRAKRGADAV